MIDRSLRLLNKSKRVWYLDHPGYMEEGLKTVRTKMSLSAQFKKIMTGIVSENKDELFKNTVLVSNIDVLNTDFLEKGLRANEPGYRQKEDYFNDDKPDYNKLKHLNDSKVRYELEWKNPEDGIEYNRLKDYGEKRMFLLNRNKGDVNLRIFRPRFR